MSEIKGHAFLLSQISKLQLVRHTLTMLKTELEEDFCNCKDQWHDPSTGHILVENMKAFERVQEEIERRMTQLEDEGGK